MAFLLIFVLVPSQEHEVKPVKKKDIRDYTDADIERLYDQWEEGEEELPEDEKPDYLKASQIFCRGFLAVSSLLDHQLTVILLWLKC